MGLFTRRVPGLQDVFPSSQISLSLPSVLDETVYPVVMFPGPLARFLELAAEDVTAPLGDDQAAAGIVPSERVRHVLYADTFHNDAATPQALEFALSGPAFITPITIAQSQAFGPNGLGGVGGTLLVPSNAPWSLNNLFPRGIMIPPGWRMQANSRPGIGAAAQITIRTRFIDYPLSDLPHW